MRFYTFTNYYLSSIQQGIQPAHCIAEAFVKYNNPQRQPDITAKEVLWEWASAHRTLICLNGGNAQGIRDCYEELVRLGQRLFLPYCEFSEDQQSLDCTMTCCGIVVPTSVYEGAAALRGDPTDIDNQLVIHRLLEPEFELAKLLNRYSLAK